MKKSDLASHARTRKTPRPYMYFIDTVVLRGPGTVSARADVVVEPSFIAKGGTWTFTVNVQNQPVTKGNPSFNLMPEVIVAQDAFLGKTFDLQGTIQLPGP